MRQIKILCDTCSKDLYAISYTRGYYLHLEEHMLRSGNEVAANGYFHHIDDDKYFCNLKCMKEWMDKNAQDR